MWVRKRACACGSFRLPWERELEARAHKNPNLTLLSHARSYALLLEVIAG